MFCLTEHVKHQTNLQPQKRFGIFTKNAEKAMACLSKEDAEEESPVDSHHYVICIP